MPPGPTTTPKLRTLLASLVAAALVVAVLEWLDLQLFRSPPALDFGDRGLLLLALAGGATLGTLVLLLAELGLGLTLGRVAAPALAALGRIEPRTAAAGLVGLVVFAGVAWVKEYTFELHYVRHAYDRVDDVALLFSTLNLLLTLPLVALGLGTSLLVRRRLPASAAPATLRVLACVSLAAAAAGGAWLLTRQAAFLPSAARLAGALGVLGLVQAALLTAGRMPRQRSEHGGLVLALLTGALVAASVLAPIGSAPAHALLLERSGLAGALVRGAARLSDLDGDGYGAVFEAVDCAPTDATIHPLADDTPGDGVDANCTGRDAAPGSPFIPLPPRPSATAPPLRLVWIVIDSLRADRVGHSTRPYPRNLTPKIEAFRARGAFDLRTARSPAANTADALPAMLTSRFPTLLRRARAAGRPGASLASLLAARGYRTAFVTPVGDHTEDARQGFGVVEDSLSHRKSYIYGVTSINVTEMAASMLQAWRAEPFFLLVHYFDPHGAYIPHKDFYFGDSDVDRYDSEVALTDAACGALLDLLASNGFLDDTVVIVTADHGEAFGEHGRVAHGGILYDEVVRVPLLVWVPGLSGRPIDAPVSLLDLTPTVLDLLGLPDPGQLQGRSLLPLLRGAPLPPAPQFFDTSWKPRTELRGVLAGDWKYVVDLATGVELLFDLGADPAERHNRIDRAPDVAETLRAAVASFRDQQLGPAAVTP